MRPGPSNQIAVSSSFPVRARTARSPSPGFPFLVYPRSSLPAPPPFTTAAAASTSSPSSMGDDYDASVPSSPAPGVAIQPSWFDNPSFSRLTTTAAPLSSGSSDLPRAQTEQTALSSSEMKGKRPISPASGQASHEADRSFKSPRIGNMTSSQGQDGQHASGSTPSQERQVDLVSRQPFPSLVPSPLASTMARDALLTYAHRIYNSPFAPFVSGMPLQEPCPEPTSPEHPYTTKLLPLLLNLQSMHPTHLPILLLIGCVYYAVGNYEASKRLNEEILRIDSSYVEAMCNLGTAYKAMGLVDDSLYWWRKAVTLRPSYWDAVNNLIGTLVVLSKERVVDSEHIKYGEVLELCELVQPRLVDSESRLIVEIPPHHMHHVQNTFYVSGSIRDFSPQVFASGGMQDYVTAIELLLHSKKAGRLLSYNFKHLVLAALLAGLQISARLSDSIARSAEKLGFPNILTKEEQETDFLALAKAGDDELLQTVLDESDGTLPAIFLTPDQARQLPSLVFRTSCGSFPSLCSLSNGNFQPPRGDVETESNNMSANIFLSIAKKLQESMTLMLFLPRFPKGHMSTGPSVVLLLYYWAFALSPSPSACNNLGIILSTTPWSIIQEAIPRGHSFPVDLGKAYYEKGLELDGDHPHLLTNMGSLLKEAGHLEEAIQLYQRAVEVHPTFDVALANLANAIKDAGRLSEAIPIYRRALEANSQLPEALCGLLHASWSVCDWRGLGFIEDGLSLDDVGNIVDDLVEKSTRKGWMPQMLEVTQTQLAAVYDVNVGVIKTIGQLQDWLSWIETSIGLDISQDAREHWTKVVREFFQNMDAKDRHNVNEGGFIIRIVEWLIRHMQWRWYTELYGQTAYAQHSIPPLVDVSQWKEKYVRPRLPSTLVAFQTTSVLPFHTFIYPFSARQLRLVANRSAARVSHQTLMRSWLPSNVYPPPPPPYNRINVAYVSSDFMDHPTSHLFVSAIGMHSARFRVFAYALSESDSSRYRERIEKEVEVFRNVASWTTQQIVEQILKDGIHILVNMNGYTKGARNDIFAARPCPIQISFLGFAGTLAAGWCDYLICDPIACPPSTRVCDICGTHAPSNAGTANGSVRIDLGSDPESASEWKYAERLIYMPHSYLVTDHKQSYGASSRSQQSKEQQWKQHEAKRKRLRRILFPDIFEDTVIFANFNQMYKIDPSIFATWISILRRVPNSILWLLRFPPAGEEHLLRTANQWAGPEIASRIRFTDVANKDDHIERVAIADIFLDTLECNAHTVAADVLWGGTPIITRPKYYHKMCSRVCASIAYATGFGDRMVVDSIAAYEERAVRLALSITPTSFRRTAGDSGQTQGELATLRKDLFMNRETMPLFDTHRWTRNLEKGYEEAWRRWVRGGTTLHFSIEGAQQQHHHESCNGFIWIRDD